MTREELELEAERNRAAVASTLEELKVRLTPGQLIDQVLAYMKDGGEEFISNLGRQVTNNPLPVTLIGAGLAWMMFGKNAMPSGDGTAGRPRWTSPHVSSTGNGSNWERTGEAIGKAGSEAANALGGMAAATAGGVGGAMRSASDVASSAYDAAADTASSASKAVGDAAAGAYHTATDAASSIYRTVGDAASGAYQTAGEAASTAYRQVKSSAVMAEEKTVRIARSALAYAQEQPLVLAGAGLALGAAIGAALPGTRTEDELFGETADDIKEKASDMAAQGLDRAVTVSQKIGEVLKEDLDVMKDDLTTAAEHIGETLSDEARTLEQDVQTAAGDRAGPTQFGAPAAKDPGPTMPEDVASADPARAAGPPPASRSSTTPYGPFGGKPR